MGKTDKNHISYKTFIYHWINLHLAKVSTHTPKTYLLCTTKIILSCLELVNTPTYVLSCLGLGDVTVIECEPMAS